MKGTSPSQLAPRRIGRDAVTRYAAQCDNGYDDSPDIIRDNMENDLQYWSEQQFTYDASGHVYTQSANNGKNEQPAAILLNRRPYLDDVRCGE